MRPKDVSELLCSGCYRMFNGLQGITPTNGGAPRRERESLWDISRDNN